MPTTDPVSPACLAAAPITLAELADKFLRAKAAQGRYGPKSVHAVANRLESLLRSAGADLPADKLTRDDIETWLGTLTHLKATSRSTYLSSIRTFTQWAAGRELIPIDPCVAVEPIRRPRSVPRALTTEQVARLLRACSNVRQEAIVWLMVGCGLRCGEVASLDWSDVSLEERMIRVTGKNSDEREVPLPAEVVAALARLPRREGAVIDSYFEAGSSVQGASVGGVVNRLFRAAGIKRGSYDGRSAHALRHTCASDVLDRCKDLRTVQQMLGHQNLATTAIYLRRADLGSMREAMEGRTYDSSME